MDVTLSDVSEKALEVCNRNKINLNSNVKSIKLDLNSKLQHSKKYDLNSVKSTIFEHKRSS